MIFNVMFWHILCNAPHKQACSHICLFSTFSPKPKICYDFVIYQECLDMIYLQYSLIIMHRVCTVLWPVVIRYKLMVPIFSSLPIQYKKTVPTVGDLLYMLYSCLLDCEMIWLYSIYPCVEDIQGIYVTMSDVSYVELWYQKDKKLIHF